MPKMKSQMLFCLPSIDNLSFSLSVPLKIGLEMENALIIGKLPAKQEANVAATIDFFSEMLIGL